MSDNRSVARDTKRARNSMTTAVVQSYRMLNALAHQQHRGRGDTWAAARDRAAKAAGIERSYAKRIWDRWQSMSDVSGEAFMRLREAYDAACERNLEMAAKHRAEREAMDALDSNRPRQAVGAGSARP